MNLRKSHGGNLDITAVMPSCNAPWRSLSIRALVGWHTIPVHDRCLHFFLQSLRTSVAIRLSRPGPQKHPRVVSERARDGGTRRHGWAASARAEWQRCLQHVLRILRGTSLRSIRRGGASGTQALPIQLRHAPTVCLCDAKLQGTAPMGT